MVPWFSEDRLLQCRSTGECCQCSIVQSHYNTSTYDVELANAIVTMTKTECRVVQLQALGVVFQLILPHPHHYQGQSNQHHHICLSHFARGCQAQMSRLQAEAEHVGVQDPFAHQGHLTLEHI